MANYRETTTFSATIRQTDPPPRRGTSSTACSHYYPVPAVVGGDLFEGCGVNAAGTGFGTRIRCSCGSHVTLGLSAVWFLIGALVWPIYFTGHVLAAVSPVRTFANVLGFYLAEGFVLAAIAGVAGTWTVRSVPQRWRPAIG